MVVVTESIGDNGEKILKEINLIGKKNVQLAVNNADSFEGKLTALKFGATTYTNDVYFFKKLVTNFSLEKKVSNFNFAISRCSFRKKYFGS